MLYIIKKEYFLTDYVLDGLKDLEQIQTISFERNNKTFGTTVLKHWRTFINNEKGVGLGHFYSAHFLENIKKIRPTDHVLLWGVENLKDILILQKELNTPHLYVFLWNPVNTISRNAYSQWEYGHYLHKHQVKVFTFDNGDAKKYGFHTVNQVYRINHDLLPTTPICHDTFFVGRDKGRAQIILPLVEKLRQDGLSCDLHLISDKHTPQRLKELTQNHLLNYTETLQHILQSRCLVEILQEGQSGMTIRNLEAVFFKKKLISNNLALVNSPFWHTNNIYLIGHSEQLWNSFKDFMEAPYHDYPQELKEQYDIRCWIKQFI